MVKFVHPLIYTGLARFAVCLDILEICYKIIHNKLQFRLTYFFLAIINNTYLCKDTLDLVYLSAGFTHKIQTDIFDDFPVTTIVKNGSLICCNDAIATVKSDLEG